MAFRFLHTADVHLDSPLKSLALRDPEIADLIGNATRQAFVGMVDLCLDEHLDAMMIAGDLYDGAFRSMKTALFFGLQMQRLAEADIKVFVIRGNHDAESKITRHLSVPDNVHVFDGRGNAVPIDGHDVVVHGVSFAEPHAPDSLLGKFKAPVPGAVNIGVLHTSLAGSEGHDTYAPCSLADLTGHGFDYWGLGHIHKRQIHADGPVHVVMPGMPQGRDIGEAGPKSATLVTIADDGKITVEERRTSIAEFAHIDVDLTALDEWAQIVGRIDGALANLRDQTPSDHLVARVRLCGESPLAMRLRRDSDMVLEETKLVAARLKRTFIDKLSLDIVAPNLSAPVSDNGPDPLTELQSLIKTEVSQSAAFQLQISDLISELQSALPPEVRDEFGASEAELAQTAAKLIEEGGNAVISQLSSPAASRQKALD